MKRRKAKSEKSSSAKVVVMPQQAKAAPWHRSLLVLLPAAAFLLCGLDHLWVTEDAYITFKSVDNFWNGYGPNFNRGLRVESFSHPLWLVILSAFRAFGYPALPPLAAVAGVVLSVVGVLAATQAARLRLDKLPRLAPIGAIAVAALPPFWDFASSGLETGLTFFWIGLTSLLLTLAAREHQRPTISALFWTLGLAPLIRPDLALPSAPLVMLALLLSRSGGEGVLPSVLRLLRVFLPGLIWQLFRMGYYGLTVPNTFLAKEGFLSRWDQGLVYLNDTYGLYWLYPVVVLLLAGSAYSSIGSARRCQERTAAFSSWAIPLALLIGGVLHTTAVVRTGGDFMHARLLLPGLFFMMSAAAVVALPSGRALRWCLLAAVSAWVFTTSLCIRSPHREGISSFGIADERAWYSHSSNAARPFTLDDYRFHRYYRIGEEAALMVLKDKLKAVYWAHIGIAVTALDKDTIVIDPLALNDHIGSHIELESRGRPGHEKVVRAAWFFARYPAGVGMVVRNQLAGAFAKPETPEAIAAARAVLTSPSVAELTDAVSAPLTWELFWKNVGRAPRLTALRIAADPIRARLALGEQPKPLPAAQ